MFAGGVRFGTTATFCETHMQQQPGVDFFVGPTTYFDYFVPNNPYQQTPHPSARSGPLKTKTKTAGQQSTAICEVVDCITPALGAGRCFKHGGNGVCTIKGCASNARVRGLCFKHGGKVLSKCTRENCTTNAGKRLKPLEKPTRGNAVLSCRAVGCTIAARLRTLCSWFFVMLICYAATDKSWAWRRETIHLAIVGHRHCIALNLTLA